MVTGSKTGEKISEEIWSILDKFGIHGKRIIPVTDAGANVKRAVDLSGFPEKHLCLGHGLHNLVTVDGVKSNPLVEGLVQKCKKVVRAVRYRAPDLELEAQKEQRQVILDTEEAQEIIEADFG